ncbi:hypothetical protein [Ktedonobacter racemifer]|uniref:Uncharacterized protein n=1 Tax=Ktedonobacter racemifer DSM 44963 TaxID=485913 RepID=D6TW92_KTERA|nr:hypothetical protein [Ktedonobacter racemifer]EFH84475.1 hypothetical protein Krac_5530 [Ktedonobacter racemifer DSM 44963]
MKFPYIPCYFRCIRSVGMIREWYGAKVARRTWDEAQYFPPPHMKRPDQTLFAGSWDDREIAHRRFDRHAWIRSEVLDSQKKLKRLHRRRVARQLRAHEKHWG